MGSKTPAVTSGRTSRVGPRRQVVIPGTSFETRQHPGRATSRSNALGLIFFRASRTSWARVSRKTQIAPDRFVSSHPVLRAGAALAGQCRKSRSKRILGSKLFATFAGFGGREDVSNEYH